MIPPSILLFDVMSTLVYDPFWKDLPRNLDTDLKTWLLDKDRHAWIEFEKGNIPTEEVFFERFFGDSFHPDGKIMKETFFENYKYLDGIPELLEKIKQRGVPCHVLSNYPIWFESLNARVGLDQYVEKIFVSYQIGIRKPDIGIYEHVIQKLNVQPQKILFVDDRLENCTAAGSIGMQYHHFQSVTALKAALHQYQILIHSQYPIPPLLHLIPHY